MPCWKRSDPSRRCHCPRTCRDVRYACGCPSSSISASARSKCLSCFRAQGCAAASSAGFARASCFTGGGFGRRAESPSELSSARGRSALGRGPRPGAGRSAQSLASRGVDRLADLTRPPPWPIGFVLEAWLLKLTFSLRGLVSAVWEARDALAAADLGSARAAVARHLVSRPVATLDAEATASAAVESLSENLTDSWVAPLCFFVVGGPPAAFVYRAVNTADAMIGYREGLLEELGWATARLDDLLNLLPSRLGALAVVAGAGLARESATGAWRAWRRDGRLTESPNAGQTMAAMAGALHVTLEKREHYRLGAGAPPDVVAIDRSVRVFAAAAGLALVAALVALRAWR